MTLVIRRVPELSRETNPSGTMLMPIYDPATQKDKHILVQDLGIGGISYPTWDPEEEYDTGNRVTWQFRLWESLQDGNSGNPPSEGALWHEVSAPLNGRIQATVGSGTVNLDMNKLREAVFTFESEISEPKTWTVQNMENALTYSVLFTLSNLSAQTFWSNKLWTTAGEFNKATKVWTPYDTGDYELGVTFDQTTHYARLFGPF